VYLICYWFQRVLRDDPTKHMSIRFQPPIQNKQCTYIFLPK